MDFSQLVKLVWSKKKLVFFIWTLVVIVGIYIAFSKQDLYEASGVVFLEYIQDNQLTGKIDGMGNVNFEIETDEIITPTYLSECIYSAGFLSKVFSTPVYFSTLDSETTVLSFMGTEVAEAESLDTSGDVVDIKNGLMNLIEDAENMIKFSFSPRQGIIEIIVLLEDPYASAELVGIILNGLKFEIIHYHERKWILHIDKLKKRLQQAEKNLDEVLTDEDLNQSIEVKSAQELVLEARTDLHRAKESLQFRKPDFVVLEPPMVPLSPVSPGKVEVIITSILIGFVLAMVAAFVTIYISTLRKAG